MEFLFTDEQLQFREIVGRFMGDKSPPAEVRRLMETDLGYNPDVWRALSNDLGLPAVHIPEEYGGQGFGFIELGIVMEEAGRALFCGPYLSSSVLAAGAILNGGDETQKTRWLQGISAGTTFGALAIAEPGAGPGFEDLKLQATRNGESWTLTGTKTRVIDGHIADVFVVVALDDANRPAAFLVQGDDPGLTRRNLDALDPTRKLSAVDLSQVAAERLPAADAETLSRTLDQAVVALANEMIGGAQHLLASAVEYSRMRMQFGRAIGSFQAIKHKCADLLIEVELARSAAYRAAWAAATGQPDLPALASLAKAAASDAYMNAAAACIQIHGGIGFTWDHDTHLWYKRAKSSEVLFGGADYHRELLVQRWSDT